MRPSVAGSGAVVPLAGVSTHPALADSVVKQKKPPKTFSLGSPTDPNHVTPPWRTGVKTVCWGAVPAPGLNDWVRRALPPKILLTVAPVADANSDENVPTLEPPNGNKLKSIPSVIVEGAAPATSSTYVPAR